MFLKNNFLNLFSRKFDWCLSWLFDDFFCFLCWCSIIFILFFIPHFLFTCPTFLEFVKSDFLAVVTDGAGCVEDDTSLQSKSVSSSSEDKASISFFWRLSVVWFLMFFDLFCHWIHYGDYLFGKCSYGN